MQAYNLSNITILVLEKHLLIRQLLTDVFEEFGVATELSTGDPEAAFDLFMTNPVDLVLSDWTPDLDGMAFLTRLRHDRVSPDSFVPVIICTAHTEMRYVCEARDLGMTEFLAKPVSPKALYDRIVSIIQNPRPFIRSKKYFGPDRRRHLEEFHGGPTRRENDGDARPSEGDGGELSPERVAGRLDRGRE